MSDRKEGEHRFVDFKSLKRVCKELELDIKDKTIQQMIAFAADTSDLKDANKQNVVYLPQFCRLVSGRPTSREVDAKIDIILGKSKAPVEEEEEEEEEEDTQADERASEGTGEKAAPKDTVHENHPIKLRVKVGDDGMFRRIVKRYWARYRNMSAAEKQRFLDTAAYASQEGVFLRAAQIRTSRLSALGLTAVEAEETLALTRDKMRLGSFYNYFKLNENDRNLFAEMLLAYRLEYADMAVSKRVWFNSQSLDDRRYFLAQKRNANRIKQVGSFLKQLKLELVSVFFHGVGIFAPSLPLLGAALTYDATYKQFEPSADTSKHTEVVGLVVQNYTLYFVVTVTYVIVYYVSKQLSGGKPAKDSLLRRLFRYLYYLTLFMNTLGSFCVLVCFIYWVLLGTVLNPEAIVPIAMGIGALMTHAVSYWKMLMGVRSKFMNKIEYYEGTVY
jgi:hypothetical protein